MSHHTRRARGPGALLAILLVCACAPPGAATVFVNKAAPGPAHDGASWATAFLTVQEGITAASPTKDEIWVAQGTYKENLTIGAGVKLYGGFAGTETALAQRDFRARVTTLDGDKKERVIYMPAGAADAVVDGFTVTNGSTTEHGGGIRANDCSPAIRNNIIIGNNANGVGGAVYTYHGAATFTANIIVNNTCAQGTVYIDYPANPRWISNVVARNRTNERRRTGIFVAHGPAVIVGNTVTDNYGGSITVYNSDSKIHNNIIAFNSSGFWRENSSPNVELKNNLFYSNMAYEWSGLDASPIGTNGNISADPKLSWDTRGVPHLQVGSPCYDAGTDAALGANDIDIDGTTRNQGVAPDIGADEGNGAAPFQDVIFVKTSGDDAKSGRSWANAKKTLQAALDAAFINGAEIWVAAGTYSERISLQAGVAMYGGFLGTETSRFQRNYRANATIIDGADGGTVVTAERWVTRGAVIDGFTIQNGLADYGAGMGLWENASPIVRNNIIRDNYARNQGGAIYHGEGGGAIVIGNVMTDNFANDRGAAVLGYRCHYSTFASNSVVRNIGRTCGLDFHNCNPVIVNNTVAWNTNLHSTSEGSFMIWDNGTCRASGNIIAFNTSGVRSNPSSVANIVFERNIVYGNFGGDWQTIASQTGKNGNLSVDPMLTLDRYGAAHIAPTSPARDAGADLTDFAAWQDIDGQARKQGAVTDIGADESDGSVPPAGPIVYVKPTGSDANSGLSWSQAKKTVTAGLELADTVNGEVWVAAGTYVTNIDLKRCASLYGGFAGNETQRSQRNPKVNLSILDGNKNGPVVRADRYVTPMVTMDGFTIRNGYSTDWGGGIRCIEWSGPTFSNNVIRDNSAVTHGGGIFVYDNGATQFVNNIVIGNWSGNRGGGAMFHRAWWSRCAGNSVVGNSSNGYYGGGIDTHACVIPVVNNTIVGNLGDGALTLWDGGGMRVYNNIVAYNQAGVRSNCSLVNTVFRNNIVFGNAGWNFSDSAIGNLIGKNGNLAVDPLVVVDPRGAAHIPASSPARDAGTNQPVLASDRDIDGGARILNGTVDIGADETDGSTPGALIVYVRPNGDDTKDGLSWANAKQTLQAGIDLASKSAGEVWAAVGPYYGPITLKNGVRIYGGFVGNEASFSQRDWRKNVTVIDGRGDRCAIAWSDCGGAVLDGFTLANGRTTEHGAALRTQDASVTLRNCVVTGAYSNNVGAVYALRGAIYVQNCVFTNNSGNDSSCLYLDGNWTGRVDNCLFAYNTVRNPNNSGQVLLYRGNVVCSNNTIVYNTGTGGLQLWDTIGTVYNNIIAFNDAGFFTNAADPDYYNNNVYGNLNWDNYPSNTDWTGTRGNTSVNPMFVNAAAGNFRLAAGSPCIDTGITAAVEPALPDLDGYARVVGAAVDRGCYEAYTTGTATKFLFQVSPLTGVVSQPLTPQPVVVATDANGRPVTTYNGQVTVSIKTGTGTTGAVLSGTKTLNFVGGYAVFGDLSIDKAGKGYILRATGALTAAESAPFEITSVPPFLQFTQQPARAMQGTPFAVQPVVKVNDGSGGTLAYSGPVVLALKPGTGTSGAVLGGTATVTAVNGVATFTDLSIDKLGTGYVLAAAAGSFTGAESAAFNVTPKAERLVFTTQPGGAVAGKVMLMQPVITVTDSAGATATDFQGSITVAIKPGTGTSGAVLNGTKTVTVVNGVASFFGLGIDRAGLRYVMTATAGSLSADSDLFRVVANSAALLTRTWTVNADFDEGRYSLVDHKPTNDQLNLQAYEVKPYLWVPNLAGSVSKIDVVTGNEVARYRTGPAYTYPNPSRTTVDLRGCCYVGNRRIGTVVKIGSEETGDWIDRNGNGVCDTSRDLNGDGNITGSEELPWNQDECVLFEVSLIPGREGTYQPGQFDQYTNDDWNPGIRSLAVDASNNLWAAGYNSNNQAARKFYSISGATGQILAVADYSATGHMAYGAVTDSNGVVWSSGQGNSPPNVLRFDPTSSPVSWRRIDLPHNPYGVGVDGLNHVFVAGWESNKISRINALTGEIEKTIDAPWRLRGVVCSADNDVWTVSTGDGKLYRYDNDLTTQKAAIPVGDQPTGCAVDKYGKIWACMLGGTDATIVRVDPATNTVDLTKPIIGSQGHYSYSDMTGGVAGTVTARRGTWTVDFDGGDLNRPWGKVSWNQSLPGGTVISVRVQSSNDKVTWSNFENAGNDADLATTPPGRYLRIEVTFSTQAVGTSPVLLDLTASAKARPAYTMDDVANALKIAAGLMTASADDFARLNVASSGLPERVNMQDVSRILRLVKMGE
jgi:hypothetical protein